MAPPSGRIEFSTVGTRKLELGAAKETNPARLLITAQIFLLKLL
jgi:hypothetical protein